MNRPIVALRVSAVAAGLVGVGLLSGCSGSAEASSPATPPPGSPQYRDGTYSADGSYQSPGGVETMHVTLALKGGVIRSVHVTGTHLTPNATHYQAAFEGAVPGVVVGKPLAGLTVGATAGSSLTPKGFDAALAAIRSEAS